MKTITNRSGRSTHRSPRRIRKKSAWTAPRAASPSNPDVALALDTPVTNRRLRTDLLLAWVAGTGA